METIVLSLRAGRDKRVRRGHPWVFSNELQGVPPELTPGDEVEIRDAAGGFVGRGYGHPGTLIAARILTRDPAERFDDGWLVGRLEAALERRRRVAPGRSAFRWVFAEADGLPGLVIDRYDSPEGRIRAVIQANTAGIDRRADGIAQVLRERFSIDAAVWRNDGRGRELEGLPLEAKVGWGVEPGEEWEVVDDRVRVLFSPLEGQKTGLFLDLWDCRRRFCPLLGRGRVADLFGYVGQWGLAAAAAGAEEVVVVDRSEDALRRVERSAELTGVGARVRTERSDVEAWMRGQAPASFDGVVCDPPSFVRARKQASAGLKAYRRLYEKALGLVRPGGLAVLASCSHHVYEDRWEDVIREAAGRAGREVVELARGGQAPCHPVPLSFPEARYLKARLLEVR